MKRGILIIIKTHSECRELVGNRRGSLLDVLGVDVARKHCSRHGRCNSVELHDAGSDGIASAGNLGRHWRLRKKRSRNTIKQKTYD